jgi:S-adenosylmethionine:tRNA ribosyltransferase-isomerase
MKIQDFNYFLNKKLIANQPQKPRDTSRLMVFDTNKNQTTHTNFLNIIKYFNKNDLIILNNSKVFPARIFGRKKTGGKIEILLLEKKEKIWKCLIKGKIAEKEKIYFNYGFAQIIKKKEKVAFIKFSQNDQKIIQKYGQTPIPPYIKKVLLEKDLRQKYQTIFANKIGSAAAPTAGLHFTNQLLEKIRAKGIKIAFVTLHVGLGTFLPITNKNFKNNKLHQEKFEIPFCTIKEIIKAKKNNKKIFVVGTTTLRALESVGNRLLDQNKKIVDKTNLFIQPGFQFQIADGLITNFHLPKSSLIILVAAFLRYKKVKKSSKKILDLYKLAQKENYRFYSFGDAMMII